MTNKPRIFVFGSCVARDTVELAGKYEVVHHSCYSSLASTFNNRKLSEPTVEQLNAGITHAWQRMGVMNDTRKKNEQLLLEKDYDLLLLDLIEERYPLLYKGGAYATMSEHFLEACPEYKNSEDQHFVLNFRRMTNWFKGVRKLLAIAKKKNIPVVLIEVYPALYNNYGVRDRGWKFGKKLSIWKYWYYTKMCFPLFLFYKLIPKNVSRIRIPSRILISDVHHKWGVLPYHYIPETYEYIAHELERICEDSIKKTGS